MEGENPVAILAKEYWAEYYSGYSGSICNAEYPGNRIFCR